jgi:hypothetical protein
MAFICSNVKDFKWKQKGSFSHAPVVNANYSRMWSFMPVIPAHQNETLFQQINKFINKYKACNWRLIWTSDMDTGFQKQVS